MLFEQGTTQQSTEEPAHEAGNEQHRSHPQWHQLLHRVDIGLPVICPLGKVAFIVGYALTFQLAASRRSPMKVL